VAGERTTSSTYWRKNLRILTLLLSIWAVAGFGLGIVAVPWLDQFRIGGFPLGFWFAQQGSIVIFVFLILVYALWMDRVERHARAEADPSDDPH
jgi:putative solute:sodium symporter small subunit